MRALTQRTMGGVRRASSVAQLLRHHRVPAGRPGGPAGRGGAGGERGADLAAEAAAQHCGGKLCRAGRGPAPVLGRAAPVLRWAEPCCAVLV